MKIKNIIQKIIDRIQCIFWCTVLTIYMGIMLGPMLLIFGIKCLCMELFGLKEKDTYEKGK